MAAYMVVLGRHDSTEWLADYVANVPAIIRRHGGEYLDVSQRVAVLEGTDLDANIAAIFTFPTLEKIREFMGCADYKPYSDLRKKHSTSMIFAFDTNAAADAS